MGTRRRSGLGFRFAVLLAASAVLAACSSDGNGLAGPFAVASGAAPGTGVEVGWSGDRFLVTFSEELAGASNEQDVVGLRLTDDGDVVDETPFLLSDFGADPFLSTDASYLPGGIAFANGAFGAFVFGTGVVSEGLPGQVVGFVSVPEDGAPALPATAVNEQASFGMAQAALSAPIAATTNGTLFLGVYLQILSSLGGFSFGEVFGQIVTPAASGITSQRIGPFTGIGIPVEGTATDASAPGVAVGASSTLVAWVQDSIPVTSPFTSTTQVAGVLLTPESQTPVTLSETASGSRSALVATDGDGFLVVWTAPSSEDESAPLTEVRAIRVAADGGASPAGGFLVDGDAAAKSLGAIAYADGVFLVAWIEDGAVEAARLGTSGDDADVFSVDPGPASSVALATDGDRFLAVFARAVDSSSSEVIGTFVSRE